MRGRMSDRASYARPAEPGQSMVGGTVGQVVRSNRPDFTTGDSILGDWDWQEYGRSDGVGAGPPGRRPDPLPGPRPNATQPGLLPVRKHLAGRPRVRRPDRLHRLLELGALPARPGDRQGPSRARFLWLPSRLCGSSQPRTVRSTRARGTPKEGPSESRDRARRRPHGRGVGDGVADGQARRAYPTLAPGGQPTRWRFGGAPRSPTAVRDPDCATENPTAPPKHKAFGGATEPDGRLQNRLRHRRHRTEKVFVLSAGRRSKGPSDQTGTTMVFLRRRRWRQASHRPPTGHLDGGLPGSGWGRVRG